MAKQDNKETFTANSFESESKTQTESTKETKVEEPKFELKNFLANEGIELKSFDIAHLIENKEDIAGKNFFDVETSGYTKAMLIKLKSESLIKDYDLSEGISSITREVLIDLANKPIDLFISEKEDKVAFIEDGKEVILNIDVTDTQSRVLISNLLPDITFDIIQGGIKERSKEAEAIYKVLILNKFFSNLFYKKILEVLSNYDVEKSFENLLNFTNLLTFIVENTTPISREICSICNLKISNVKSKKEMKVNTFISKVEDQKLRSLRIDLVIKRSEWENVIKNGKTKAKRESLREDLREKERAIIESSDVGIIYKILKLNSEDINSNIFTKFNMIADDLAEKIKQNEDLGKYPSLFQSVKKKLKRRCYREFLAEFKITLFEKLIDGEIIDFNDFSKLNRHRSKS
jgi:hypothetical protein